MWIFLFFISQFRGSGHFGSILYSDNMMQLKVLDFAQVCEDHPEGILCFLDLQTSFSMPCVPLHWRRIGTITTNTTHGVKNDPSNPPLKSTVDNCLMIKTILDGDSLLILCWTAQELDFLYNKRTCWPWQLDNFQYLKTIKPTSTNMLLGKFNDCGDSHKQNELWSSRSSYFSPWTV